MSLWHGPNTFACFKMWFDVTLMPKYIFLWVGEQGPIQVHSRELNIKLCPIKLQQAEWKGNYCYYRQTDATYRSIENVQPEIRNNTSVAIGGSDQMGQRCDNLWLEDLHIQAFPPVITSWVKKKKMLNVPGSVLPPVALPPGHSQILFCNHVTSS